MISPETHYKIALFIVGVIVAIVGISLMYWFVLIATLPLVVLVTVGPALVYFVVSGFVRYDEHCSGGGSSC